MYFAKTKDDKRVFIREAKVSEKYFCPICSCEMIQKRGTVKAWHFSHKGKCTDSWHREMSKWHFDWQQRFPESCREITIERDGVKHRADVVEGDVVFEFQNSPMTSDEFWERNQFYNKAGYKVVWIFNLTKKKNKNSMRCLVNYAYDLGDPFNRRLVSLDHEISALLMFNPRYNTDVMVFLQTDEWNENMPYSWNFDRLKCVVDLESYVLGRSSLPRGCTYVPEYYGHDTVPECFRGFIGFIRKSNMDLMTVTPIGTNGTRVPNFSVYDVMCRRNWNIHYMKSMK